MYAQPRLRDQNRGLLPPPMPNITSAMSGRYRHGAIRYNGLKTSYGLFLKAIPHVALCLSKYEVVALPSLAYSKNDFVDNNKIVQCTGSCLQAISADERKACCRRLLGTGLADVPSGNLRCDGVVCPEYELVGTFCVQAAGACANLIVCLEGLA